MLFHKAQGHLLASVVFSNAATHEVSATYPPYYSSSFVLRFSLRFRRILIGFITRSPRLPLPEVEGCCLDGSGFVPSGGAQY